MAQSVDEASNGLDDIGRSGFLDELADFYKGRGYRVVAQERSFPRQSEEVMGTVDLFLEDTFSTNYRVVEATKTGELDPSILRSYVERKQEQAEKARDYFSTNIDPERIDTEVVVGTEGDLNTVRELLAGTSGVFSWDQALDTVSEPGRLGSLKDDGYLPLNYGASREENEEYFELSPELEGAVDILREYRTYP